MSALSLSDCTASTPKFTFAGLRTLAKVVAVEPGGLIDVVFDTPGFGIRKHRAHLATRDRQSPRPSWQLKGILLNKIFSMYVVSMAYNGDLIVQFADSVTSADVEDIAKASSLPDGPYSASSFADDFCVDTASAVDTFHPYGC